MVIKVKVLLFLIIVQSIILRFLWLDRIPPSLYTDEINQGYNAYSILLTGKDEHGAFFPVSLRSFGDWKPPLQTYLTIPFIFLLGLTEYAIRLPSVVLGIGTIVLTYSLVNELFNGNREKDLISLLSAFFLSISPWHILQSRAAMLVTVGLFFLELGILLFIKGIKTKKLLILSSIAFTMSIYSYYGLRVIAPLTILILLINYKRQSTFLLRPLFLAFLISLILLLPLFLGFLKEKDVVFGRAKTVSIFYDKGVKLRQWELITQDGLSSNTIITRFFHNNLYMYGRNILQRFLSHFDGRYLFFNGDQSPPFQIPNMGILYLIEVITIPFGMYFIYKTKINSRNFIILWLAISIIPAALTFMTPSSNRTFTMIVPLYILSAIGFFFLRKISKHITSISALLVYGISFYYFLHQYFIVLPKYHSDWWNYGWKETVQYIKTIESSYDNIIVSDIFGMPYIYFLFYGNYHPIKYQNEADRSYVADRFGFEHVEGFRKYLFPNDFDWDFTKKYNLQPKTVYVIPNQQAITDTDYKKAIYYPDGKIAFKIFIYD